MTKYSKGEWTNARYDICEIECDGEVYCTVATKDVELIIDVLNENGQLKQRNTRQAKQLDRLYNLIEQKDWRALNDILDDFKRCEEQLRKEWGTYGDLE